MSHHSPTPDVNETPHLASLCRRQHISFPLSILISQVSYPSLHTIPSKTVLAPRYTNFLILYIKVILHMYLLLELTALRKLNYFVISGALLHSTPLASLHVRIFRFIFFPAARGERSRRHTETASTGCFLVNMSSLSSESYYIRGPPEIRSWRRVKIEGFYIGLVILSSFILSTCSRESKLDATVKVDI